MRPEYGKMIGNKSQTNVGDEPSFLPDSLKFRYFAPPDGPGETIGYYPNGQMRFDYPLLKGNIHGLGKAWYEDGQIICEEEFRNGLRHGRQRFWYPSGAVKSEGVYVNGCRSGEYKEWYENGNIKLQLEYSHDTVPDADLLYGICIKWHPNGKMAKRVSYVFNIKHGVYQEWDETGKLHDKRIYVRNVRVSGELHRHIVAGTLTAKHILGITNAAIRRICLEELGYGRFLSQVPHQILNKDDDYELIKIDWHKREEPIYLVKVKCPSTGAFYTLRVPPEMKTVKEAIAWTFGLNKIEYKPEIET